MFAIHGTYFELDYRRFVQNAHDLEKHRPGEGGSHLRNPLGIYRAALPSISRIGLMLLLGDLLFSRAIS